jgi:uncharacterized protein YwgA
MTDREKVKFFQKIKSLTTRGFWDLINALNSQAYDMAVKHMQEAMSMHPRISKRMIEEVTERSKKVREDWDGLYAVDMTDEEVENYKRIVGRN